MTSTQSSRSGQTAATDPLRRVENTFAPNCDCEYFTPATLFGAFRVGSFSVENLPSEAKKMLDEYIKEYLERCPKPGDNVEIPDIPDDVEYQTPRAQRPPKNA